MVSLSENDWDSQSIRKILEFTNHSICMILEPLGIYINPILAQGPTALQLVCICTSVAPLCPPSLPAKEEWVGRD